MQTLREIYTAHKIMPGLQVHQVRVASVAKFINGGMRRELDERSMIIACLFHDMGNIIKSDLTHFREFFQQDGVTHWEGVKAEFILKYGENTHEANVTIARELGLPEHVIRLIDGVGFSNLTKTSQSDSWEQKIVEYADCRVGPYGVLSLRERHEEARARYLLQPQTKAEFSKEKYDEYVHAAEIIEQQIFTGCAIEPTDITDAAIAPIVEQMWEYKVEL